MTEELREGLYLAATGMGLVFLSLLAFMLILIALAKLFPAEEVEEVDAAVETLEAAVQEPAQEAQPAPVELAPAAPPEQAAPLPEPAAPAPAPPQAGVSGAKIAAMAVAMYLAMEQEEVAAGVPLKPLQSWTCPGFPVDGASRAGPRCGRARDDDRRHTDREAMAPTLPERG